MAKPVEPGVKCKVISSSRGPSGSTVGRIVRVVDRADPPEHVMWGPMWDCIPVDGGPFEVKVTSPDMQTHAIKSMSNATFAEDWLLPIDEDLPEAQTRQREQELSN